LVHDPDRRKANAKKREEKREAERKAHKDRREKEMMDAAIAVMESPNLEAAVDVLRKSWRW
jgi:hypothetical protein